MMLGIYAVYDKSVEGRGASTLRRLEMAGPNTDPVGIPHETLHSVDMTKFSNNLIMLPKITNKPLFD